MKKIFLLTVVVLFVIAFNSQGLAADWKSYSYKVLKVKDGDTAVLTDGNVKFTVRFAGMDAPESQQPYGKVATYQLKQLILDQSVKVKTVSSGLDRYGRVLAQVYLDNKDVSLTMIEGGYASYYRPRCKDYPANKDKYNYDPRTYIEAENKARVGKQNMWSQNNVVLPCQYRKTK